MTPRQQELRQKIASWNGECVGDLSVWLEELQELVEEQDPDDTVCSYVDPGDWGFHNKTIEAELMDMNAQDVWAGDKEGWILYGTEGWEIGTLADYKGE